MGHVGTAHTRLEDDRFLTGRGRFVDDIRLPGEAHAAFVRSPHAHARIGAIATERARSMPGVLAVLTGEDWRRDGGGDTDVLWDITSHDGTPMALARRPVFATDEARHVGDTVALVVAEDPHAAADAAAAVDVAWEPLASVTDLAAAALAGSAAGARGIREQRLLRLAARRRRGGQGRLRRRRPCDGAQARQQSPRAERHRAARCDRRIRSRQRALHALVHHPEPASRPPVALARHAACARAIDQGGRAGCRRRLRPEDLSLSGGGEPPLGRAAGGPAGALDRDPCRDPDGGHPRARPRYRGAHGLRRGWAYRRHRGGDHRQPRRLSEPVRCVHPLAVLRHHVLRPVCDPRAPLPGARRLHQHHTGRCLPRRRQSRDHLRHRAPDREWRARAGLRLGRGARPQPRARCRHALWQCDRRHLRCRRLSGGSRQGPCARRSRRAPGRADAAPGRRRADGDRHGGLRSLRRCRAEPPRGRPRQPHGVLGRRHRARPPQRQDHRALRQPQPRPVPRHDVCADRRRPLRLRARRH